MLSFKIKKMLKQSLQQKLLQKLSPQQIQVIKLLEVPTIQLEQRIKKELEENPALEEGDEFDDEVKDDNNEIEGDENEDIEESDNSQDEFSLEDYIEDDEIPAYKLSVNNYSSDDERKEIPFSIGSTFHENLESQIDFLFITEEQKTLAKYIIGNIDDDGYLRREIESIVDDLAFSLNITTTDFEIKHLLDIIQQLDPPGVGARDLKECILLQIKRKPLADRIIKLTHEILTEYFDEFTKKHYDKIIKKLSISEDDMKQVISEIVKLNPKPGSSFSDPLNKSFNHIIPDFIIEENDGELNITLNSRNVPELKVSRKYIEMLNEYKGKKNNRQKKEAVAFVKQKIDSAKWFIDAIVQRQNTLLGTMEAIVNYQYDYFIDGDETKLKPMILKDIAEITGLDISTISRVGNSKYVQTHFGIIPLKFFFSESMQTDTGDEVSSREIKKILQNCIEAEDKKNPLTDDKLARILQDKGYHIARRTVAKYREMLNIAVGRLRREL